VSRKAAQPLNCFEAGGLALTQSSATGKPEGGTWMSGRMIEIVRTLWNEIKKVGVLEGATKKTAGGNSESCGKSPFSP
jgi:hypothetical protein